jgi:hypothetical protein
MSIKNVIFKAKKDLLHEISSKLKSWYHKSSGLLCDVEGFKTDFFHEISIQNFITSKINTKFEILLH